MDAVAGCADRFKNLWGGYDINTRITSQKIEIDLSNTNSLIEMNLQPSALGFSILIKVFFLSYIRDIRI